MRKFKIYLIIMLSVAAMLCSGCKEGTAEDKSPEQLVPIEYTETIEDYKKIVQFRLSEQFESEYNSGKFVELNKNLEADISSSFQYKWDNMIADMLDSIEEPSMESFGYILTDLNGDNVLELIWVNSDYNVVFAVFTIRNNEAHMLDAYWSRYKGKVLDFGMLYTLGSGGADTFEYTISNVDQNESSGLKVIKRFGSENGKYFEATDNGDVTIGKERFIEMLFEYPFEFGETWRDNRIHLLESQAIYN